MATAACDGRINRHTRILQGIAYDHTAELVTQNEGRCNGFIAGGAVFNPMQVRSANADCFNLDKHFAFRRAGDRLFVKSQIIDAMQA